MWKTPGSTETDRWRDSTFVIPSQLTVGKSGVSIQIRPVGGTTRWSEFFYWVRSTVAGLESETDRLDVGNAASEQAHRYYAFAQVATPEPWLTYPPV
jgi:hypothetical protein